MNGSQAATLLRNRLTLFSTSAGTVLTEEILLQELNLAMQRLEKEKVLPFFLISEEARENTIIDDERVKVPARFLREIEADSLWVFDAAGKRHLMKKGFLDTIRMSYPDPGMPKEYSLHGFYYRVRPIPNAVFVVSMTYYKGDDPIVADEENQWLTYEPDLLMAETGHVVAILYLRDERAQAKFESWRNECYVRMVNNETARMQINTNPNPED